ncbi:MAG: PEGA domain-containing protein [Candidatus Marinimicrobia bacterium]|jgi:TolB-like protein|nr:PEGA domain-containing protein [Candidatus Neomarinimicrobiota bacterium]MBT3496527.1 PEGA domain-containing protein [Candidatus Neomarinimicrobiota bacterium]MBT3691900.1 PEGA domain-containing protein [Candidatus Neomarinimicrobiota bacterium]MBT3732069.1 PEGA domain-containing protein [Candidatus Neomarinimicrobiota bacterium]MBT4144241.1 PEGA domain-containing protein [Candidatus Neomarinimicrobiota bacterium]
MKKNYIILLFYLFVSQIVGQERIAVLQFDGSGVDAITAKNISKRFSYYLSTTNRFDIVEREMMDKILEEQKFQNSGCVADECAVEIGELIGVSQIVAGSVDKILDSYSLNIKLVDVATGKIIYQDMDDYEGRVTDFIKVTIKNMAMRLAAEAKVGEVQEGGDLTQYASTKKGKVIFNVDQNNVAIFIDGQYNSRSSGNQVVLSIAEGLHTIKFSRSSFKDWEKKFNVIANEEMTYDVKLIPGIAAKVEATTGILLVRSEPGDASVYVDGIEKGMTTLQITDIGIGDHEIRVEKNLYYAYTEIVTIHPDMIGEVKAILKPNFGSLSIKSNPTASVVMINGQVKGKTPYSIDRIKSGTYNIQVSKDLYHTHEENFIITDGSVNSRDILLTPAFGKLIVKTTPRGAKVKIDGQSKGVTPFELDELPSGNYHLSLTKDMYQSIEQDIVIDDGKTFDLNLKLEARSGLLSIIGGPKGASVFVNGQKIGHIPVQDFRIAEGMVELSASSQDYHSQSEFLNIKRDQTYEHVFNLDRHTGKLIVITQPPDAEIYLDKEGQGKTPKILDGIPVGIHTIDIKHPSFLAQSETFTLTLNEKKNFRFKLMTYDGSIQQDIDMGKFKQRISLGSSAAFAVIGFAMQTLAVKNYDAYLNAGSSNDATNFYNKTSLQDRIAVGSYGFASALLLPALKFTWDIGKLKKQLNNR